MFAKKSETEEKKVKVIRDGYNVSVESVEDAIKAREPVIKELLDFVKLSLQNARTNSKVAHVSVDRK